MNDCIDRLLLNLASLSTRFGANLREFLGSLHRSLGYCQDDGEYSLMIEASPECTQAAANRKPNPTIQILPKIALPSQIEKKSLTTDNQVVRT